MQVLLLDALPGRGIARISALLWFPPLPQFPLLSAAARACIYEYAGRRPVWPTIFHRHPHTHAHTCGNEPRKGSHGDSEAHDPFEIRGFGPIFLPLLCNKANPHHSESCIFPAECIYPASYYYTDSLTFAMDLLSQGSWKRWRINSVPRNKFIEKKNLSNNVVVIIIIIVPFFRSYISHTARISSELQSEFYLVTQFRLTCSV